LSLSEPEDYGGGRTIDMPLVTQRALPRVAKIKEVKLHCFPSLFYRTLQYYLLDPKAKPPSKASAFDAGILLYNLEEVNLLPGEKAVLDTGVGFRFPAGTCGLTCLTSSTAAKYKLMLHPTVTSETKNDVKIDFRISLNRHRLQRSHQTGGAI
jgi:hypothetical protein